MRGSSVVICLRTVSALAGTIVSSGRRDDALAVEIAVLLLGDGLASVLAFALVIEVVASVVVAD